MAVTPLVGDALALLLAGVTGLGIGVGIMVGTEVIRAMRRTPRGGRHERDNGD